MHPEQNDDIDSPPNGMEPPERPMVFPGHFVAPTNAPLFIEATMQVDDKGDPWVMLRAEYVNGTFACFLTPESAVSFIDDLGNAINAAIAHKPGVVVPNLLDGIDIARN